MEVDRPGDGLQRPEMLEIHFEIASRCGLSCLHCSSESNQEAAPSSMSHSSVVAFARSMGRALMLTVSLTGGEPLASGQLLEVAGGLHALGTVSRLGFFTSGCVPLSAGRLGAVDAELAVRLREAGIDFCYVSLHSHLSSVHDSFTGVAASHQHSIQSIASLLEGGIDARVHFVPTRQNHTGVREMIHFLDGIRVPEVRFLRLVKHGRAGRQWALIGLSRLEQAATVRHAMRTVEEGGLSIRISAAGFPELMDCRPFGEGRLCQAGIGLLYVDSDGRVFPCACKKKDRYSCLGEVGDSGVLSKVLSVQRRHNVTCLQDT